MYYQHQIKPVVMDCQRLVHIISFHNFISTSYCCIIAMRCAIYIASSAGSFSDRNISSVNQWCIASLSNQ